MGKITRFKDIPKFVSDGNWQCDFTLDDALEWVDKEVKESGLVLNPEFQRGHVWTEEQQIKWVEYFLRGGKSGTVIYLNNPFWRGCAKPKSNAYTDYVCVDGLQRLTAARRFVNNEIRVFGSYFREYEDKMRVGGNTLKINVNDLKTEKEVLQWYIDINAGGTPHTKEEIDKVRLLLKGCSNGKKVNYENTELFSYESREK